MGFIGWAAMLSVAYYLSVSTFAPDWFESHGYYAGVIACWLLAFVMAYTTGKRPKLSSFLATSTGVFLLCGLISLSFGIWARFIKQPDDKISWPFDALTEMTSAPLDSVSFYCIMLGAAVVVLGGIFASKYTGKGDSR